MKGLPFILDLMPQALSPFCAWPAAQRLSIALCHKDPAEEYEMNNDYADCYQTLGVSRDASPAEIKKAYFRLVREHSPEKDPEGFQKIRAAYEEISTANKEESLSFPQPTDPFAQKILKEILTSNRSGNYERSKKLCMEAVRIFPDDAQFHFLLISAYRMCGNSGKAVKAAETLLESDPNNKWYVRELAVCYVERGWMKTKGLKACDKAYALGIRDVEFILLYSSALRTNRQYDKALRILEELYNSKKYWQQEDMPEFLEILFRLSFLSFNTLETEQDRLFHLVCTELQKYVHYLADYYYELHALFISLITLCKKDFIARSKELFSCLSALEKIVHPEKENAEYFEAFKEAILSTLFLADPRIGDLLKMAHNVYYEPNPEYEKFDQTDIQLCLIEKKDELFPEFEIIHNDYPDFFEKLQPLSGKILAGGNLRFLKDGLLKIYRRLEPYYEGGQYYELYPEEKIRSKGIAVTSPDDTSPRIRTGRKIGRNEPCPCGSGKKYKNCCLKKETG